MKFVKFHARGVLAVTLAAASLAMVSAPGAWAQGGASAEEAAKRFGARASVLDISLSPSGERIAWIAAGPGHAEVLNVADMGGSAQAEQIVSNSEITGDLQRCEWATDERLICQIHIMQETGGGVLLPFTRMIAVDHDGSDVEMLSERRSIRALGYSQDGGNIVALEVDGEPGQVLMTRTWVPERNTRSRIANTKSGLGVDRIDIESGNRKVEEMPDDGAGTYIADQTGAVRFKTRYPTDNRGYLTGGEVHMVRAAGQSDWEQLDGVTLDGQTIEGFEPVAVDAVRDSLLAFHTIDAFRALIEIPLDGSNAARVLARRDDVDVDELLRIGRERRVVGVSYAAEKRDVEFFDPDLAKLARALGTALPGRPLIDFVGASADENTLLIAASSDTDPGMVYLYDKPARKLEELMPMRGFLAGRDMGVMRPITFPASDGTEIPGYLTLPPGVDNRTEAKGLPAIVLPHGGPAARDYWGFDWLVQFFTNRGYAVLQPNYRGSSGYGEAWFGRNGFKAWDLAIGDVNDAGRWLVNKGIADPERLGIVGWSYGGYAALQSQVVDPDLYQAVVAIAPVTDFEYVLDTARNYTNFRMQADELGDGPHLVEGSPRRHARAFQAPVALFHGTMDLNVDVRHSRAMADALKDAGKPVKYVEFDDLQHDLGDSNVRARMLREIDGFLASAFGR